LFFTNIQIKRKEDKTGKPTKESDVMNITELIVDPSIVLRILTISDSPTIFEAIDKNRYHLRKWLPFVDLTKTEKDTLAFVKSIVDDFERRQEVFTIWYNGEFSGLAGLKDIDYLNRKIEIGYWLIDKMTGKGIMIRSVERLIRFIYDELEMNRIQIRCGAGNQKSAEIPKKLGFLFEGIERQGERHHARYIDLEVYSLLKVEWCELP
jgi:ribosomal-protein-serine acetyltransferase